MLLRASAVQILAALLQAATIPGLIGVGIRPELPVVVTVGWASLRGWAEGLFVGLVGGLVIDFMSAAPFGLNAVRMGMVGLAAGFVAGRLARTTALFPVMAAGAGTILAFIIGVLGLQAAGWMVAWERALIAPTLPNAALTALCMAAALPLLRAIERRTLEDDEIVADVAA